MRGVLKPRDERIGNDAYFTPRALAFAICERLDDLQPKTVLEPGAGSGAFFHAASLQWPGAKVSGVDVDPQASYIKRGDFLSDPGLGHYSLIVGNPPYVHAEAFVSRALMHADYTAFLLRLSFLGGQGRARTIWSRRSLRWLIPITPRPSFTPDGKTDASEYAVFVWKMAHVGNAEILPVLKWDRSASSPRQLPLEGPDRDPGAAA